MAAQPVSGGGEIKAGLERSKGVARIIRTIPDSINDDLTVDYSCLSQIHLPGCTLSR